MNDSPSAPRKDGSGPGRAKAGGAEASPRPRRRKERIVIGWREWVGLPALGIDEIKAKVDTGARTSTLHAFEVRPVRRKGVRHVRFKVHPVQRRRRPEVECVAPVVEERVVRNSAGKTQLRFVIATVLRIGERNMPIELTLTNRDEMSFRMLIGRNALRGPFVVNPGASFRTGRIRAPAKRRASPGGAPSGASRERR